MLWGGSMQMKADGLAFLVIEQRDGEKVSYALSDIRKITFDSDYMYLNLSSGTTEALLVNGTAFGPNPGGSIFSDLEGAAKFSPFTYIDADDAPFLMFHGDEHDTSVSPVAA